MYLNYLQVEIVACIMCPTIKHHYDFLLNYLKYLHLHYNEEINNKVPYYFRRQYRIVITFSMICKQNTEINYNFVHNNVESSFLTFGKLHKPYICLIKYRGQNC